MCKSTLGIGCYNCCWN
ncbi:hypothetical protein Gorai_013589 [Gossypium raimondii]|uniref:Uncharacterized protein n=1 Tax=Gossypium raimondii TaxID=29730 RepID=A0A7J8Q694_GOSRA|nr:hypothetical protein [Gossypium raimondii]